MPLWKFNAAAVKSLLKELFPPWEEFHVADKSEYLGDFVGPGSDADTWTEVLNKYLQRCRIVGGSGLSLISRLILHRMFAISVTQLRAPPAQHASIKRKGVYMEIGGQYSAYPMSFLLTACK